MKMFFILLVLCSIGSVGCSDKQPSEANSPPAEPDAGATLEPDVAASAPAAHATPGRSATPARVQSAQPVQGVVDPFLTSQLKVFIQQKGRLPESFAEFASARLDSVPRLTRGLAFAIDATTQEVKIIRQ